MCVEVEGGVGGHLVGVDDVLALVSIDVEEGNASESQRKLVIDGSDGTARAAEKKREYTYILFGISFV